jgi:hypothetical protein
MIFNASLVSVVTMAVSTFLAVDGESAATCR